MTQRVRVLVADDHAPMRMGVRRALEHDGFDVVAEASSARTAVERALSERPDVCVLDVHMPGSGIAAAAQILRDVPEASVVMLTYSRDDTDLFDALRVGVHGFLNKDMDPDRLGAALRGVLNGEAALPRTLVAKVLEELRARPQRRLFGAGQRRGPQLTSREWEIMELLRDGLTTDQAAERLFVSTSTVRVHVSNVVKKLRAPDRETALAMFRDEQR